MEHPNPHSLHHRPSACLTVRQPFLPHPRPKTLHPSLHAHIVLTHHLHLTAHRHPPHIRTPNLTPQNATGEILPLSLLRLPVPNSHTRAPTHHHRPPALVHNLVTFLLSAAFPRLWTTIALFPESRNPHHRRPLCSRPYGFSEK